MNNRTKMSSEDVLSIEDQRNREETSPTIESVGKSASEMSNDHVADPTTGLKMAGTRASQGTKRHLSLSPSHELRDYTSGKTDLQILNSTVIGHISKKRVISSHEMKELQDASELTGNDPDKGQGKTGNQPDTKQLRTKSKMAAPTSENNNTHTQIVEEAYRHETEECVNAGEQTSSRMSPQPSPPLSPTTDSGYTEDNEQTLLKNRIADETNGNINSSISDTNWDNNSEEMPTLALTKGAIETKDKPQVIPDPLSLSDNSLTNNPSSDSLPINDKLRQEEHATTTVPTPDAPLPPHRSPTKNFPDSASTVPDPVPTIPAPDAPNTSDARLPPDAPDAPLPPRSPPIKNFPDPVSLNKAKSGLRKLSKPSSPSLSTRLRSQLRNKTGKNKTDFNLHKHCAGCANCTACEQYAKNPDSKNKTSRTSKPAATLKTTRGRGRPRKQDTGKEKEKGKNKEQVPKDIQSLFFDIKGDISDVNVQINDMKIQQVNSKEEFCNLLDSKLTEVKQTVGLELSGIKDKVGQNECMLDQMKTAQAQMENKVSVLEDLQNNVSTNSNFISNISNEQKTIRKNVELINGKVVSMQDKTCDLELSIVKQNRAHEQVNWEMSGHIQDVEYGLAAHIETIKGNMEKELVGAKQNQIFLENKLSDFTNEIDQQNSNLNEKIQELRNDFEQLKTDYISAIDSPFLNTYSGATASSFSNPSAQSGYPNTPSSVSSMESGNSMNSCDPENQPPTDPDSFYMYGDTSKTLIMDGLRESRHENLGEIMFHCFTEIGIPLDPSDIQEAVRIGKFNSNRKWPRPVKVTFKEQTKRDQIFIFKSRLRFSETFKDIRINEEQRKDIRIKSAKLRQAGLTAKKMGCKVESLPGQVRIDGIEYNTLTLDSIPSIFMREANKTESNPQNIRRENLFDKTTAKSSKVIMVGPSLQKTPYGLAFYSVNCYLSNFYPCELYFRDQRFTSLEQAYQCTKAEICENRAAYQAILKAETPALMKAIGKEIQTNDHWEKIKLRAMEDLIYAKFKQNKTLYYSLMNTRPMDLIEATLDKYWGANCTLGSVALQEGSWEGLNHLGRLLMKVRDYFAKELERREDTSS